MRRIVRCFPYYAAAFMFLGGCTKSTGADLTVDQVADMIKTDKEIVVLDIRTPQEYASGHIPKAINIDYYSPNFKGELSKLDKNKKYILYCRSGRRSASALEIAKGLGLNNSYNMLGGMLKWKGAVE